MNCLLCGSGHIEEQDTLSVADILRLYKKHFGFSPDGSFKELSRIFLSKCLDCDLRFFHPVVTASEEVYARLQNFAWYYVNEKQEYTFAASQIGANDSILEIGCGKGAFAKRISAVHYTGLEFNKKAVEDARAAGVSVLAEPVAQHARGNAARYDDVCMFQVLEHVAAPRDFLADSVACLRAGGRLIISVPSVDSYCGDVMNFSMDMPPHHSTRWSDAALRSIAALLDLDLINLWHEPLPSEQESFYVRTVLLRAMYGRLNRPMRNIDLSMTKKLLTLISLITGKFIGGALIRGDGSRPFGVSVVAVYRKQF